MNRSSIIAFGAMAWLSAAGVAIAATAERSSAGTLRDGANVEAVTLRNASGVSARIFAYDATLQSLEPQKFPDTPNRPEFGSARLNPGETYRHTMILRVSAAE